MLLRITIGLLLISNFLNCSKESSTKPYGFLNLRVEGQEEDIRWENIIADWNDSLDKIEMQATSYFFDQCHLNLPNVSDTGRINNITLAIFYYTDGIDFQPVLVEGGHIHITDRKSKSVGGTFEIFMRSDFNGTLSKKISGSFGVFN